MSNKDITIKLIYIFFILSPFFQVANGNSLLLNENNTSTLCPQNNCIFSNLSIVEKKEFYGLASYYNAIHFYRVEKNNITRIEADSKVVLDKEQWFAVVGRLNVLLIKASKLEIEMTARNLILHDQPVLQRTATYLKIVKKSDLSSISPELDQIRYVHLWNSLAWLAKQIEWALVAIQSNIVNNWGLTIVIFSLILKLFLLPVSLMTAHFQRRVSQIQTQLAPELATIKANYDGEEAHNRLMLAYKKLGVTPFYTLKPMIGALIQIPILIAVFNALGEMPQLYGQSFLWIENLSYPDSIAYLPFSIPMFGNAISLLPFIMTVITVFSTIIFKNPHAPDTEVSRQKFNLYLMAIAFFILFYPFPAAMVLYWALANILQTMQQLMIKV